MTVSRARGAKAKCDILASKLTRARGSCVNCGSTQALQTCHIISRRYSHTRTDLTNLLCGCAKCHAYWTGNPVEFARFVLALIGEDAYQALNTKSLRRSKMDWPAELLRLQGLQ